MTSLRITFRPVAAPHQAPKSKAGKVFTVVHSQISMSRPLAGKTTATRIMTISPGRLQTLDQVSAASSTSLSTKAPGHMRQHLVSEVDTLLIMW